MSSPLAVDPTAPSDAELIALVRGGDSRAYGQLFERHRAAATRLARQLVPASDADDLVSEAFIKVLKVLTDGGGPDVAFRPYLLTAVRRLHVDRIRATSKVTPSDEMERFDPGVPFADPALSEFENSAAAKAFASLPERWQMVLWHLEVEGQKPADVAPLLGMSANSVSALAYRAREGLRQAYLQMHLADTAAENCRWTTERLGAHVRGGLSKRDAAKVDQHLDECPRCAAIYLELAEVNSNLRGIVAPLLLGAAATGYLASAGGGAGLGLLGGWLFQTRKLVTANPAGTVGAAAAGVAAAAVVTAVIAGIPDSPRDTVSDVAQGNQGPNIAVDTTTDSAPPSGQPTRSQGPTAGATTRPGSPATQPTVGQGTRTPASTVGIPSTGSAPLGGLGTEPGGFPTDSGSPSSSSDSSDANGPRSSDGPSTSASHPTRSSAPTSTTSSSSTRPPSTSTPPETTTTPPPPPPLDLGLRFASVDVAGAAAKGKPTGDNMYRVTVTMELSGVNDQTADPSIRMRAWLPRKTVVDSDDLACRYVTSAKRIRTFDCDVTNPSGDLWVTFTFNEHTKPKKSWLIQGTVSLPGDENPGNDTDTYYPPK